MTSPDPRPLLRRSYDVALVVVGGVGDDQWHLKTPCTEFDVRQLTAHLVGAAARPAEVASGAEIVGMPELGDEIPEGGYGPELRRNSEAALQAFADAESLDRDFVLPWGTYSGRSIVDMYAIEMTAHAWDLAVATGQDDKLDDELAEALLPAAREMIVEEYRGGEMPFAAVVEVEDGARTADQFAGWLGRSRI
ncbi:MAG: TIGR03086 family metal-binding protein [Acidimicrobiales bacterium]